MVNKLAEYWLQHCNFDTVSFPRYVGFPNQFLVSNEYEYVYAIDKYLNEKNCYVRAFSEFQLDHNLYNKLYFERYMRINSICVLGGGTAGFSISSLLSRYKELSGLDFDIKLVYSEKIKTIGVGESR